MYPSEKESGSGRTGSRPLFTIPVPAPESGDPRTKTDKKRKENVKKAIKTQIKRKNKHSDF